MTYQKFIDYYKEILKFSEDEFTIFKSCFNQPLPYTFRCLDNSDLIADKISHYSFITKIPEFKNVYSFYSKDTKSENYKNFIQFLTVQNMCGNIQRQEIVSMLPHLFLNLKSNHKVLEMCASPGSKTKQILEILNYEGLLVSNDKSINRTNVLIKEATKKPKDSFIITTMDATLIPNMNIKFDRICCDVPCTSDGTLRKNSALFNKWDFKNGLALCNLQYRILKRGLELLDDNGILVYSTCSMNPIENEYVINKALYLGKYELVDTHKSVNIKGIFLRKGFIEFKYEKIEFNNKELEKCIRIMPHDQNTGGFFIAVLKIKQKNKIKLINESINECINEKNNEFIKNKSINEFIKNELVKESNKDEYFKIEKVDINKIIDKNNFKNIIPVKFKKLRYNIFLVPEEICENILKKYNLNNNNKYYYISFTNKFKNIFALTPLAYDFIKSNPKLKIVYCGIKAFSLTTLNNNEYRIKNNFIEYLNFESDCYATFEDIKKLINETTVEIEKLSFKPKAIGHFILSYKKLNMKFCGFFGGKIVFLYIENEKKNSLKNLYNF